MNKKNYLYNENPFDMNYKIFYPDSYGDLPLIVYLHGAGERGYESSHLFRHGIPKLIKEGMEIPAVVLCPQCPAWCVWDNVVDRVKAIIDLTASEFAIQKDRICITGSSMGGFGTWMMGATYSSFFAAIAPVAGGGMSWRAGNLRTTPVLATHGTADKSVPPIYSELMVNAVNASGGKAELVLLDGMGHNDGIDYAYRSTNLVSWLLAQRRTDFDRGPEYCSQYF
jgi:predicted peptidase